MIKHFREICKGCSFSVQIIEKFCGSGYVNNKVCHDAREIRLQREEYWMKTLRTIYPYGLNERVRHNIDNIPIGNLFPPIPRFSNHNSII